MTLSPTSTLAEVAAELRGMTSDPIQVDLDSIADAIDPPPGSVTVSIPRTTADEFIGWIGLQETNTYGVIARALREAIEAPAPAPLRDREGDIWTPLPDGRYEHNGERAALSWITEFFGPLEPVA